MLAGPARDPVTQETLVRIWMDRAGAPAPAVRARLGAPVLSTVRALPLSSEIEAWIGHWPRSLFEIRGLPPDREIEISSDAESCRVRTLPRPGDPLLLLLGSCFSIEEDRGALWRAVRSLQTTGERPHLRILGGDQLYMDVPGFPTEGDAVENTARRYRKYWSDPDYGAFLSDGLTVFTADDHEFWNDYPHNSVWLSRTWSRQAREDHEKAALGGYLTHQTLTNPDGARWFEFDLGLVSLFVTDTRTARQRLDQDRPVSTVSLFDEAQIGALESWCQRRHERPGLLVLGPPLFQNPTGRVLGNTTARNLLAYPSHARRLWTALDHAPGDILILSGDIHIGRIAEWQSLAGRTLYEVVSSPLSLIQVERQMRRLHLGKPGPAPGELKPYGDAGPKRSPVRTIYATGQSHFTLLRVTPFGGDVQAEVKVRKVGDGRIPSSDLDPHGLCNFLLELTSRSGI